MRVGTGVVDGVHDSKLDVNGSEPSSLHDSDVTRPSASGAAVPRLASDRADFCTVKCTVSVGRCWTSFDG